VEIRYGISENIVGHCLLMLLIFVLFFLGKVPFAEQQSDPKSIKGIESDILNLFIYPQILIGTTAMYAFIEANVGFKMARYKNLETRFMQRAAIDVLQIIKHFGFVTPIPVSWDKLGRLFLPEDPDCSEEGDFDVADFVHKSPREKISFFSNSLEVLKLLFIWAAKKKSLACAIRGPVTKLVHSRTKNGAMVTKSRKLVLSDGQLDSKKDFPVIHEDAFQLLFFHKDKPTTKISVPEALYSLLTGGKSTSEAEGKNPITFENLISDLNVEDNPGKLLRKLQKIEQEGTGTYIKNRMEPVVVKKKGPSEDDDVSGEPKKKKKSRKKVLKKNVWLKGTCPLEPVPDTSDEEEEVVPVVQPESVSVGQDGFMESGNFKFQKLELAKLGMNDEEGVMKPQSDDFDGVISVHAEKLIRLMMARSARMHIDPGNSNHTSFGPSYFQPEAADGNKKTTTNAQVDRLYCSGLSRDLVHFLSGLCNFAYDQQLKCNESDTVDPYQVLNMVRNGSVLLNPVRRELHTMSKYLFEDVQGADFISNSIAHEEAVLLSKKTEAEETTKASYVKMDVFCKSRMKNVEKSQENTFATNALDSTSNDGGRGDGSNTEQESLTVTEFDSNVLYSTSHDLGKGEGGETEQASHTELEVDSNVLDSSSNDGDEGEGGDTEQASHAEMETKKSDVADNDFAFEETNYNTSSDDISQHEDEGEGDKMNLEQASESDSSDEETSHSKQVSQSESIDKETAQASQPRKRKAVSDPLDTSDSEENDNEESKSKQDPSDSKANVNEESKSKQKVAQGKRLSPMERESIASQKLVVKKTGNPAPKRVTEKKQARPTRKKKK
jgi:hypothetical protein